MWTPRLQGHPTLGVVQTLLCHVAFMLSVALQLGLCCQLSLGFGSGFGPCIIVGLITCSLYKTWSVSLSTKINLYHRD